MTNARRIILVDTPVVGCHEAISRVRALARDGDTEVTVLTTIECAPGLPSRAGLDVGNLIREESRTRARAIVADLKRGGVNASSKVRAGVPFVEVIKEAHEARADFVIKVSESMASRGSNIGTMDRHLLRKCPCPIWITRRRERVPYRRVFAAVDLVDHSSARDTELDIRIVDLAARVARSDGAEVTIVHAWEMIGEGTLRGRAGYSASEVRQMLNQTRETRERRIRELAADLLDGVEYDVRIIKGKPRRVVPHVVEHERADLLVMGAVARTGLFGFLIGSTAEEIIEQVGCAILALKPAGFASSVLPTPTCAFRTLHTLVEDAGLREDRRID